MVCAYCGKEAKGTKEHIVSCAILDLFPECYITFDETRNRIHESDPMVKDVCADCNNNRISYIDSYAKDFIAKYFIQTYSENDRVMTAYNDMRSHKEDCSFFDEEIKQFLMNSNDAIPKANITILCGLAVNVSPVPDAMFGNLKLRWGKNPLFYSNSTIRNINYETGQITLNEDIEKENFPDLKISYVFRFNSVQFLLCCPAN